MRVAPIPVGEGDRVRELHTYSILDTPADPQFDAFTDLAALICETPISLISLVDSDRQWFKSRHGFDVAETSRDVSFCSHCVAANEGLVVEDARRDQRFSDNPLVVGAPHIRFYAGAPLRTSTGACLGTLCVIDREPRSLTNTQQRALANISRSIESQLESYRKAQESQKLYEQLKLTSDNLTTFMRAASHDLRGPLRTIMLMSDAVRPAVTGNDKAMRFVVGIHDAAQRARRLVDDLLTHARVDAGEQRGPVDLERCVAEVCTDLDEMIELSCASVTCTGLPVVQGSATAWIVIMKNLVENAIKYTPRDRSPRVQVIGVHVAGQVSFEVVDNACGIEADWEERIFEPLVRFHTSEVPGSGIGLATVQKLITQMGGTVRVRRGDAEGSVFTVAVPLAN